MIKSIILLLSFITAIYSGITPNGLKPYGVIDASTITNSGFSVINADLALYPGVSVTGFPPGIINGVQQITSPTALLAQGMVSTVYGQIANMPCTTIITPAELGGRTLGPGVYCSAVPVTLNGVLSLDSQGNPAPVWIFQLATTLITASSSVIQFVSTPAPCNVFWNVGSSATLGSGSRFIGIINAHTSITLDTSAVITGKAMAQNAAVTLLGNTLTNCVEVTGGSFTCFGVSSTNSTVCGGNGQCINNDTCFCNGGYNGNQCQN